MNDRLRRLHPASILIELLRRLGSLAYLFAIALLLRFFGSSSRTETYDWVIAGLAVFSALSAVLRYLTLRFGVQERHLVVRSGLFVKQHRTIPLDRIQNVELKRNVLHRMLGLVDVDVETAGGATPEARLSALGEAEAEQLKAELMLRAVETPGESPTRIAAPGTPAAAIPEAPPTAPTGEIVWTSSTGDLLLAGATENRLGVILAAVSGFAYTFQEVLERVLRQHAAEWYSAAASHQTLLIIIAVAGAILLILIGWIASIAITYAKYFGFQMRRDGPRMRLRYGLFTHVERLLPTRRIQTIRLDAPWLRRLLRCTTMQADTAGSAIEHAAGESTPLCPLIRVDALPGFARNVFPHLLLEELRWLPVSRLTIRRGFIRYAGVVAILSAPFWWLGWVALILPAVGLVLAGFAAHARYRALAYAELGEFVLARAGVMTRRTWIIPRTKIQWIELIQTPFQRRLGLASIAIHTAAPGSRTAHVVDLPAGTAVELQERLSRYSNQTGLVLDGV